jgi:5-methylcytosine-specific restriction endonuclease McrA
LQELKSWLWKAHVQQVTYPSELEQKLLNGEIEPASDKIRKMIERTKKQLERMEKCQNIAAAKAKRVAKHTNKIHRRKEAMLKLPYTLTEEQWEEIKNYFDNRCAYCGKEKPLQQEHFIPVSKGGEYTHNNIIPACGDCNFKKLNHDFFEWYPKQKSYSELRERKILNYLGYTGKTQQLRLFV